MIVIYHFVYEMSDSKVMSQEANPHICETATRECVVFCFCVLAHKLLPNYKLIMAISWQ